jgi:predicted sulfurtransferase
MNQTRRLFLGALSAALLAAASNGWAQTAPPGDAPRITAGDLKPLIAKGEAILVDVRNEAAWELSHIDGARHIPLAELSARLGELPKDKLIACYCT